jgi:hypothetical protein
MIQNLCRPDQAHSEATDITGFLSHVLPAEVVTSPGLGVAFVPLTSAALVGLSAVVSLFLVRARRGDVSADGGEETLTELSEVV